MKAVSAARLRWLLVTVLTGTVIASPAGQDGPARAPSVERLNAWLDARETEWAATAHLQGVPDAAIRLLLEPGRVTSGPDDDWTAPMLALAKLGDRAVPAMVDRLDAILDGRDRQAPDASVFVPAHPLITVLGSIGPSAVPALVHIAERTETAAIAVDALDQIVLMEPRTKVFGQDVPPWTLWRPADDRLPDLDRQLVPLLPRVRQLMERAAKGWKPQALEPQRPGAYLLARWGEGEDRSRGRQVLVELARTDEPFYHALESVRLLHALGSPETAALIRATAARVPRTTPGRDQYLTQMATALRQLEDTESADAAVRSAMFDRIDADLQNPDAAANGPTDPIGMNAPTVVTRLLALVQRSVPGAMERLELSLGAPSPDVRIFGALALSAYDKPRAVAALAEEAKAREAWRRSRAAEYLLLLGDSRGIAPRLEDLETGDGPTRTFACRDLRVYTQVTLPCDQPSAWRTWWNDNGPTFRVRSREAALDLRLFPRITPVSLGALRVQ